MQKVQFSLAAFGATMAAVVLALSLGAAAPATQAPAALSTTLPALNMQPVIPDDPAKVAAARQFLVLFRPRMDPKLVSAQVEKTMSRFVAAALRANPKLNVKEFEQVRRSNVMKVTLVSLDVQSRVVSRHFTLQELKELIAFCRTPVGQKLAAETPKIQMDVFHIKQQMQGMRLPGAVPLGTQKSPANASKIVVKQQ